MMFRIAVTALASIALLTACTAEDKKVSDSRVVWTDTSRGQVMCIYGDSFQTAPNCDWDHPKSKETP